MKQATLTYPDELPRLLDVSESELPEELQMLAAAKLFELGRLSAGKAAELAGLTRLSFLARLGELGVPAINLGEDEAKDEVEAARELGARDWHAAAR